MHRDFLPNAAKFCGALVLASSLTACSSDLLSDGASGSVDTEYPTSTTPTVTTTVEAPPGGSAEGLEPEYVAKVLELTWTSLAEPEAAIDFSSVLTPDATEELENQRSEWDANNWYQEGLPAIVSTEIQPGENAETAVARVCVDSNPVKVLDANSVEVNEEVAEEADRSLMIAVFAHDQGAWKLAEQQFPDDPNC